MAYRLLTEQQQRGEIPKDNKMTEDCIWGEKRTEKCGISELTPVWKSSTTINTAVDRGKAGPHSEYIHPDLFHLRTPLQKGCKIFKLKKKKKPDFV